MIDMIRFNYRGKEMNFVYHYKEIRNLKFELERHKGYLPAMMRPLNMSFVKYLKTNEEAGIDIMEQLRAERHMTGDEHITAYIDFCLANPRYTYLLKEDLYVQQG